MRRARRTGIGYAPDVRRTPRKGPSSPDWLPPLPVPAGLRCAHCGDAVRPDERDDADPQRHVVCDPSLRRALARRIEATRAVHRALVALEGMPTVRRRLADRIAALPDACDVHDALAFLEAARAACASELAPPQRRLAVSFFEAAARKLGA